MRQKGRHILGIVAVCCMMAASMFLAACGKDDAAAKKVRDLEFSVVTEAEAPEELRALIGEKKMQPFKLTYSDEANLFIVVGYGPQETGGYSIRAQELYLTDNSIVVKTELLGPEKGETAAAERSYPVIILKTELLEEPVTFQ